MIEPLRLDLISKPLDPSNIFLLFFTIFLSNLLMCLVYNKGYISLKDSLESLE